jgi:hypothetical protein
MMNHRALTTCLAGIFAATMSLAGAPEDQIDQTNGDTANWDGVDGISFARWNAQQFSPGLPFLTAVEFAGLGEGHSWTTIPPGETIRVEIYSTSGGLPDTLLATIDRTTPLSTGGGAEWSGRFDLPAPLDVSAFVPSAGSMFIALTVPNASTTGEWSTLFTNEGGGSGFSYPDGTWFESTNGGFTWNIRSDRDLSFRTYGLSSTGAVLSVTNVVVSDTVALAFPSTSNVNYVLECNPDPDTQPWDSAGWQVTGDGNTMSMYDATGFDSNKVYRVRELN